MVLLVKLLSIAVIVYGCILILRPSTLKKIIECVKQDNRIYTACGIKAAVGVFLMFASSYCSITWIVLFLGALSAFGGIAGFVIKKSFFIEITERVEKGPLWYAHLAGTIALAIGALLALAA
ncbi:MAG: hypothetical protein ABID83_00055 [Candidatus Omnitrophota bacterium]